MVRTDVEKSSTNASGISRCLMWSTSFAQKESSRKSCNLEAYYCINNLYSFKCFCLQKFELKGNPNDQFKRSVVTSSIKQSHSLVNNTLMQNFLKYRMSRNKDIISLRTRFLSRFLSRGPVSIRSVAMKFTE